MGRFFKAFGFPSSAGFWGGGARDLSSNLVFTGALPGSVLDWQGEAGQLWKNSTVAVCLHWLAQAFPEAPLVVIRSAADGTKKTLPDHPLARLVRRPGGEERKGGAAVPGSALWAALLLSLLTDGNAYWVLRRNGGARVVGIEYVPHWLIEPKWSAPGEFISYYSYRPGSQEQRLDPESVVHFRDGLDPENTRKGLATLKATLREIVSDNEGTSYTAAILKNMGVPGTIITPPPGVTVTDGYQTRIKLLWREIVTGERRGEALVFKDPFTIQSPAFSPEQLALDKIRAIPQATICAALRVPPMVVGLSVGDAQRTYANMREAREMVEESTIIPLYALIAETINAQLLPQLSNRPDEAAEFDLSQVRVLQQDRNELYTRVTRAFQANLLTRAEARTELGFAPDAARDEVFYSDTRPAPVAPTGPNTADPGAQKALEGEARRVLIEAAKARRIEAERRRSDAGSGLE